MRGHTKKRCKPYSNPLIRSGWMGFVLALVGIATVFLPIFQKLEEQAGLTLLYTSRGVRQPHQDVVIVNIDQFSANAFALPLQPEKWPRTIFQKGMYYVYVLSAIGKNWIYIGLTTDLKGRMSAHHSGKCASTRRYLPLRLIYYEAYLSYADASMREQRLKYHGNAVRMLKQRIKGSLKNGAG